jgi:hypothetical protein
MSESPQVEPKRQRRDKLPPSERHARHLEASRRYYSRYFNFNFSKKYMLHLPFSRNKQRIREEQRVRSRKLVIPFVRIFTTTHLLLTRHREKLKKEKHEKDEKLQKDISERHSCVCTHCGQQFPGENEIGYSDTSDDAESEDNPSL